MIKEMVNSSARDFFDPRICFGARQNITLFGQSLLNQTKAQAVDSLMNNLGQVQRRVAFLNADCVNRLFEDVEYRLALDNFEFKYADGVGMRIAAHFQDEEFIDNVNGTDLFPLLIQRMAQEESRVFLLGGKPGVAQNVADRLERQNPALSVVGAQHGYFNSDQAQSIIDQINKSQANILFVAFGAPMQEKWIAQYANQLNPKLIVGVGGLFDFYSGKVSRAPKWMRDRSLEWVWRLLVQPKDKARRYLVGNPLFLIRALRHGKRQPLNKVVALKRSLKTLYWSHRCRLSAYVKRVFDCFVSSSILLVISPFLVCVAALIRLESPGAVLFHQTRVGKNGKPFTMYKFRSMYIDAEQRRAALTAQNESGDGVIFKIKRDPRITPIGRFIRTFSIDELPQLWNVVKGDMSLVGPRPPLPSEIAQYHARHNYRLQSRPGITCIWQVSGRSDIPFEKQVELDIDYIRQKSLFKDIRILLKTIPAVIFARGAY